MLQCKSFKFNFKSYLLFVEQDDAQSSIPTGTLIGMKNNTCYSVQELT
jgi:hypothetical protein